MPSIPTDFNFSLQFNLGNVLDIVLPGQPGISWVVKEIILDWVAETGAAGAQYYYFFHYHETTPGSGVLVQRNLGVFGNAVAADGFHEWTWTGEIVSPPGCLVRLGNTALGVPANIAVVMQVGGTCL